MENEKILIMNNLDNLLKSFKNINKDDEIEMDNFLWKFRQNQLLTYNELLTEDEFSEYLKEYMYKNASTLITPKAIEKIVDNEIKKDDNADIDTFYTISLQLDENFDRQIHIEKEDKILLNDYDEDLTFYDLDDYLSEANIKDICDSMLSTTDMDKKEINDFIDKRIKDYKELPYNEDYLEGFIDGYLENEI